MARSSIRTVAAANQPNLMLIRIPARPDKEISSTYF